jgi:hypothetical protein
MIAAVVLFVVVVGQAFAGPLDETRLCGPPKRTASGDILRRADVLRAFELVHPCPVLGQASVRPGTCPGWRRDHVLPLACGGCDAVSNLQWLPTAQWSEKSGWERKIYGGALMSEGCP